MGDPKFPRRLYATPFHPWKAERIVEERGLEMKYGLKNKKEVWRTKSHLRALRGQARELLAKSRAGDAQAIKETRQLLAKLNRSGLLPDTATLDDVLAMDVEMLLQRRLQTQVYLKGLTASPNQARQFINHGHISVAGTRMSVPGYYLKRGEENQIIILADSPVADAAHPVRPKRPEGAGPPRLKEIKAPETFARGRGPPRGGGGPGGPRRGPPGGGFGGGPRGPPPTGRGFQAPGGPAPPAAPGAGPEPSREDQKKKPLKKEPRMQGGGAF